VPRPTWYTDALIGLIVKPEEYAFKQKFESM
jgi:hypothetical protein